MINRVCFSSRLVPLIGLVVILLIMMVFLSRTFGSDAVYASQVDGNPNPASVVPVDDNEGLRAFQQIDGDQEIPKMVVVRAYFTDRQMVYDLAAWKEPWEVRYDEGYLVVGVTEAEKRRLLQAGFRLEVDEAFTRQMNEPRRAQANQGGGIPGYACYRTVEETYASAAELASTHPTLATWTDIGDSWQKTQNSTEGYDLMVLKLTNSEISGTKPTLFLLSAIHAREYATAELNTRFAEYLLTNYNVDADVTWLLDYHEIHLMLQGNPDGRKWAEQGYSWRKNTNNNFCSDRTLRGVDLNRNFEFQWGCCGGSSSTQCAETYRGPSPASEPEIQAIQNHMKLIFPDQRENAITATAPMTATGVFVDIHSYSQLVLWPWGFTDQVPPNGPALQTLGRKLAHFNNYYPEQAIGLYPTDGTTDDFVYGELGVAAYTFELGTTFFQNCSTFENTILPDNLPALLYAAKVARTPYMTPAGPDALDLTLSESTISAGTLLTLSAILNDTRFNNNNGSEATEAIAAAEYYLDLPPWDTTTASEPFSMAASDKLFDSPIESVTAQIDTSGLSVGRHTIFVRGQDSAQNWGPISAIFLEITDGATSGTPTPTATVSNTPTVVNTPTATVSNTPTVMNTPTATVSNTPTVINTPTATPTTTAGDVHLFYLPLIGR